jgi:hypothetical protein
MKGLKKIIVWTLIPVVVEMLGFFYIDNFYLKDQTTFTTNKVNVSSAKSNNKIDVTIPSDGKNIGVSYNGDYISYYQNGGIEVIDTTNNKKNEITVGDNIKISSYKWLPDRDIMLIAEKYNNGYGTSYIQLESYNAKKNEKTVLSDQNNKQLKILLPDNKYDVLDMTLSTATNVTYIKIGKNGVRSKLYRINVMVQMENVNYFFGKLGKIVATNKEDKLVYEDLTNNRIRVVGLKDPIATGENAMHYLLNTDNEDQIYIGNGENGKVNKIFVASLKKPRKDWNVITLKKAVNRDDIYITRFGKIYVNDSLKGTVTDLETGKQTSYKGVLIQIYDSGVISKSDNKVIGTAF